MNVSRRAVKLPLPQIGVAVVALGVGVTALSRLSADNENPIPVPGAGPVRDFGIRNQRVGMSPSERGSIQIPQVEFEVEIPKAKAEHLQAWLQGSDGKRLALAELEKPTPHVRGFGRLGYPEALKNPHLILSNDGQTVFDRELPELPAPARAIPLVVPIEPSLRFRRPTKAEAAALGKTYPGETFFMLQSKEEKPWPLPAHVLRTSWSAQASVGFRLPGAPKAPPAFGIEDVDAGGIAELDIPSHFVDTISQEATLDLEIVDRDGTPAIRVLRPLVVDFSDGASYEIRALERLAASGKGKDAGRSFGLAIRDTDGHSALVIPTSKPFEIGPMPPARREGSGHPTFEDYKRFNIEVLSPSIESLGISRFRIGNFEFKAKEGKLPPLAYGKHQLRLRLTRCNISWYDRRMFVAIDK